MSQRIIRFRQSHVVFGVTALIGVAAGGVAAQGHFPFPRTELPYGVRSVAWGDIDGDGDIDAVVSTWNQGEMDHLLVLLNDGAGALSVHQSFDVGLGYNQKLVLSDYDQDGDLDIWVHEGGMLIYENDGAGNFHHATTALTGSSQGAAVGDLNGDGYPDLVSLRTANTAVFINQQDGSFSDAVNYYSPGVDCVGMADLDGDGDLDIVTSGSSPGGYRFFNNGDGSFGPRMAFAEDHRLFGQVLADMNSDGYPDMIAINLVSNRIVVVMNDGAGGLADPVTYPSDDRYVSIIKMDFDNDGHQDIVARNEDGALFWFRSEQDGSLAGPFETGTRTRSGPVNLVGGPFAYDADGNGVEDLVSVAEARSWPSNHLITHFRSAESGFVGADYYSLSNESIYYSEFADLNGDGYPDMIGMSDSNDYTIYIRLTIGNGVYAEPQQYVLDRRVVEFLLFDHDADQDLDLFIIMDGSADGVVSVMRNSGGGQFESPETLLVADWYPTRYEAFEAGDVDGDGVTDLVLRTRLADGIPVEPATLEVRLGDGAGAYVFASVQDILVNGSLTIRLFDQDGDGDLDILLRNQYIEIGPGGSQSPYESVLMRSNFVFADLDQDGYGDIVSGQNDLLVSWGNPAGGFLEPEQFGSSQSYHQVLLSDVDGDGNTDIITSGDGIGVLVNSGSRQFMEAGKYAYDSIWFLHPLRMVDLDLDGRDEVVLSDLGALWVYQNLSNLCIADLTGDGMLDFFDISAFLNAFAASEPAADLDGNGLFDFFDISTFLNAFNAGCP